MNYQLIYDKLIEKAKNRIIPGGDYIEVHHIIPDFMYINRSRRGPIGHLPGDPQSRENLVRLYPREHFVAHLLLDKILYGTRYSYSAKSSLMLFSKVASSQSSTPRQDGLTSYEYELARRIGIKGISESRRGQMPCIDAHTGESVGSHPTSHPNILSGKWVHHSTGRMAVIEISTGKRFTITVDEYRSTYKYDPRYIFPSIRCSSGTKNPNYKELTPDIKEFLFSCVPHSVIDGHLIGKILVANVNEGIGEFGIKKISNAFFKNKFGGFDGFVKSYNQSNDKQIKYHPYFRGK